MTTRIDDLLAEASKRSCEAVVISSMRQVHLLVEGSLRPFSNRALSTAEILAMLLEVAPATVSNALEGDCELAFTFKAALGPVDVKVDKKAEFVFARITIPRANVVNRSTRTPISPFEGLDLDLSSIADAARAAASPAPVPPPARPPPPAQVAPVKGVFPKPFGCEVELELGTFINKKPDLSALGVPEVQPDFGTVRDFEMDGAADEPLELDTGDHAAGPAAPVPSHPANRDALTPPSVAVGSASATPDALIPAAPGAATTAAPAKKWVSPVLDLEPDMLRDSDLESMPAIPSPARGLAPEAREAPTPPAQRPLTAPSPSHGARNLGSMLPRLLQALVDNGGSDLHLAPGSPPRIRVRGELVGMGDHLMTTGELDAMYELVLDAEQKERWQKENALDFSLDVPGLGRFRANVFRQRKGLDLVFRAIAPRVPTFAELGLPPQVDKLTTFPNGLILVTGPAGCGKSTTQAAIIDRINETWHDHVITVEDPVEFVHPVKNCLVNQREVGTHVRTFAEALRSALREDPDVILVGELRDLETIQLAITAAETGHLVLGTLHTIDSARTIDRLIDVFPGEQKLQMRSMVSESLRGVISQRLLPAAEGNGRVAAFELLMADRSISNLIREGKTFQIPNILKTGKAKGMVSMDDSLIALVRAKKITVEVALQNMERPEDLTKLLKQPGPARPGGPPGSAAAASARAKGGPAPGRRG